MRRLTRRRDNQRRRTRKDLLDAAATLLKDGRTPTVAEVAQTAMVSRATAYRYFPTADALLAAAPLDREVPSGADLFATDRTSDPAARLDKAEAALHRMIVRNEDQLRAMLAAALDRRTRTDDDDVPVRDSRRTDLIEAALAPVRHEFNPDTYETLCAALALIFGTESMVVCRDVLHVGPRRARQIKRWAIEAFVSAARERARGG